MAGAPNKTYYVLITGANSGLGYATACRLITEFLERHSGWERLHLIVTTRSEAKKDDTLGRLRQHLQRAVKDTAKFNRHTLTTGKAPVDLAGELVDLTALASVRSLVRRLRASLPKLDALICNAGIGGWTGVDFVAATKDCLVDFKHAVTWPSFKLAEKGRTTKPQLPQQAGTDKQSTTSTEPALGEVFCANVFGHYFLAHGVTGLLSRASSTDGHRGRIIWLSSIDCTGQDLSLDDLQGIASAKPYETSKRLTDVLALTAGMGATKPWVEQFYHGAGDADAGRPPPKMYVAQPGVCGTNLMPLPFPAGYFMILAFHIARWLGSLWHTITAHKGACAVVWLALSPQPDLDAQEAGKPAKWGSATDRLGEEKVLRTEVDGWGWTGVVGEETRKGRRKGVKDLTEEDRETFVETGRECWKRMEGLRVEWEERLDAVETEKA